MTNSAKIKFKNLFDELIPPSENKLFSSFVQTLLQIFLQGEQVLNFSSCFSMPQKCYEVQYNVISDWKSPLKNLGSKLRQNWVENGT